MNKPTRFLSSVTLLAMGQLAFYSVADVPAGYYDSLEGKSGVALKQAVKKLISNHTVVEYGEDTWKVFEESDTRTINDNIVWWDMYSANNMRLIDGHNGLNIEHSVANSWWGGKSGSREAYMDVHHLNPSNADANGRKSNYPLGEIEGKAYWTNGVTTIGTPKSGLGGSSKYVFEPSDVYKGDFARAYFYIFTLYDDISWSTDNDKAYMYDVSSSLLLQPWAYELLLQWAQADPVSYKEMERNEVINKYQKNRNPFIDCPQLASHIWGDKKSEPFHYSLYVPEDEDPQYPGWDEEPIDMIQGQWVPVKTDDELSEEYTYFIVSPTKNRAMTHTLISTGKAIDECFYSPDHDLLSYPEVITGVPPEIASVKLEKGNGGWYVRVFDAAGNSAGYMRTTTKNQTTLTTKSSDNGCLVQIKARFDKTNIEFTLSDGSKATLQYNASNPRFAAYSSSQAPIQLYRQSDTYLTDPDPEEAGISTGFEENGPEVITGIYDINGRKVDASSVSGLDKGIYIVISNFGTKKIKK